MTIHTSDLTPTPSPAQVTTPAGTRPGRRARLAVILGSLAVTFGLMEVGIHLVEARTGPLFFAGLTNPEYNPGFVRPHPVLDVEHVPNALRVYGFPEYHGGRIELRTNEHGLREDEPTSDAKPAGALRVLVLGDSQTDGLVANDESFVNVAEKVLNSSFRRADGRRYELINAGVITYQPVHEYLWWKQYGAALKPDWVFWVLFTGNDLLDASGTRVTMRGDVAEIDEAPKPVASTSSTQQLLRACRTCALISLPFRGGPLESWLQRFGLVSASTLNDGQLLRAHRLCRGCIWQSLNQPFRYGKKPEQFDLDMRAVRSIMGQMKADVEAEGAKLAVVVLPSKLQVEGDDVPQTRQVAEVLGLSSYDPPLEDRVGVGFVAAAEASRLPVLDLMPALRAAFRTGGKPLYYAVDWHLNVEGHLVVAAALADWLTTQLGVESTGIR